jgi:hypothetical protein
MKNPVPDALVFNIVNGSRTVGNSDSLKAPQGREFDNQGYPSNFLRHGLKEG